MKYNGRAAATIRLHHSSATFFLAEAPRATSGTWLRENSPGARVARGAARSCLQRGAVRRACASDRVRDSTAARSWQSGPRASPDVSWPLHRPWHWRARRPPHHPRRPPPAPTAPRSATPPAEASSRICRPPRPSTASHDAFRRRSPHSDIHQLWILNDCRHLRYRLPYLDPSQFDAVAIFR